MTSTCKTETTAVANISGRWAPGKPALRSLVEDMGIRAAAMAGVGVDRLVGSRAGGSPGILMYHRIAPNVPGVAKPPYNVTPARFRRQISGLLARGFAIWPLRKIIEHWECGRAVPSRTVAITFDDGFETVYSRAWPVLRELNSPATVFVSTAYLDAASPFPFDSWGTRHRGRVPPETYRPMTTAQCRELAEDGLVELGAHTHTHQDFRNRVESFREDLQTSVDILRSRFSLDNVMFAFPYGASRLGFVSKAMVAAARQAGVICSLTTDAELADLRTDPFRWGRLNVFPWDTGATLAAKLNGWYSWAPKLRQAVSKTLFDLRKRRLRWPAYSTS